jgi:IclR family acetate operon transcriptional repressor
MTDNSDRTVGAIPTMFQIISQIKALDDATVTELADSLNMPKSTVHNHLTTLEKEGYLIRDGTTYQIGLKFLELGEYARMRTDIYEYAKPVIDTLAQETGEIANLWVEENGCAVILYNASGQNATQIKTYSGRRGNYSHASAGGKTVLAYLSGEQLTEIIERDGLPALTDKTITDEETLRTELETIREQGFAYDEQEIQKGLRCVAAPILSSEDEYIASISVSGPKTRLHNNQFREELPETVVGATETVEINRSYGRPFID